MTRGLRRGGSLGWRARPDRRPWSLVLDWAGRTQVSPSNQGHGPTLGRGIWFWTGGEECWLSHRRCLLAGRGLEGGGPATASKAAVGGNEGSIAREARGAGAPGALEMSAPVSPPWRVRPRPGPEMQNRTVGISVMAGWPRAGQSRRTPPPSCVGDAGRQPRRQRPVAHPADCVPGTAA